MKRGFDALAKGRTDEAGACCQQILSLAPKTVAAHFLVGLVASETEETRIAIQAFGSVTKLDPSHAAAWAQLARHLMKLGMPQRAEDAVSGAIKVGTKDPMVEDLIGTTLSALGDQTQAREWFSRAVKKKPRSAMFNQNLASTLIFLGKQKEAEAALDRVLEVSPHEPQAHWRKASLKKAQDHTHIDELTGLMARYESEPRLLSFVAYAAGKEYEDLEEWEQAFRCFSVGARAKKQIVEYDEAAEIRLFEALREVFTPEWMASESISSESISSESISSKTMSSERKGIASDAPIFIVGQPRTGTTLVERIITSHSMVHSAGELQQFGLSVRRHAQIESTERYPAEMFRAAAAVDPAKIGATYMLSSDSMQGDLPRFVDKMPVNFLFLPLIAKAIPNAKIIHLVRDPMDSCFSSFKQLFAEAYYHSYDLHEMARHHVRYYRLMEYWRELMPGQFLDMRYEDVVSDLPPHARKLIDYLELPWEDACLEFHRQDRAVMTASAVQVREKVHTRSVGRWEAYETQLQPVLDILRSEGILN